MNLVIKLKSENVIEILNKLMDNVRCLKVETNYNIIMHRLCKK